MSKCSSCNQALPELRAVNVAPSGFSYHGKATATCCRAFGDDDGAALKALVESDSRLMLVTEKQLNEDLRGHDWHGEFLNERRQVQTLQARNAELVRKLDEVRRAAKL